MKPNLLALIAFVMLLATEPGVAQLTPAPSSSQTIIQDFGLGKIVLTYSRPNVKGRKIFGYTEPYNQVWRTGANAATTIKFSDDVTVEGLKVVAGIYGLFSIPGADSWTIILSKKPTQWGAYTYSQADDYLRFKVKPVKMQDNLETLTMQFANVFPTAGELRIMWEHTELVVHMNIDIDDKVMTRIDSAMQTPKKPYYDAVIYYLDNNKDMNKALVWANELSTVPGLPPMAACYWKARVLARKGDKAAAVATANEGIKAAEAVKSTEYIRLNREVIAEANK